MSAFIPAIEALSDAEFADHMLSGPRVVCPALPPLSDGDVARAREIVSGRFTYTGETHALSCEAAWQHNPSRDKEWLIALHKHYFAVDLMQALFATGDAAFLESWMALTERWLLETRPGELAASDAHVDAKRIESWVAAYGLLRGSPLKSRVCGGFLRRFLARLWEDALYVSQNLRPARNHRTFQLYSLVLAGAVFPEFLDARALLALGREKLIENLLHDFGEDGVHIEGSTHYHNITLETALAFVTLSRTAGFEIPLALERKLEEALDFSAFVQFPDGEIPLLNDSDNGDHSQMLRDGAFLFGKPELLWAGSRGREGQPPASSSRAFGGYFVLSDGWGRDAASFADRQYVVFDCAPLGEGSHSHYDLFNVTWFARGRQIVVDPGRYTYDAELGEGGLDWRHTFKSTRSHNTIEIDGRDQTRYLSKAKTVAPGLARLDRTRDKTKHGPEIRRLGCSFHLGERSDWVVAAGESHEYRPVHTRALLFMQKSYVVILDHVAMIDGEAHSAALRYHFAASEMGRLKLSEAGQQVTVSGDGFCAHVVVPARAVARLQDSWVSKTYGIKVRAPCLEVLAQGQSSLLFMTLLLPNGTIGEIDASLTETGLQTFEGSIRGRVLGVEIVDRVVVDLRGHGLAVTRTAGDGRPLYATGNLDELGGIVAAFETVT